MKMYVNAAGETRMKLHAAEALDDLMCEYLEDPVISDDDALWHGLHVLQARWTMALTKARVTTADMDDDKYERALLRTISVDTTISEREMEAIEAIVCIYGNKRWNKCGASLADAQTVAHAFGIDLGDDA